MKQLLVSSSSQDFSSELSLEMLFSKYLGHRELKLVLGLRTVLGCSF